MNQRDLAEVWRLYGHFKRYISKLISSPQSLILASVLQFFTSPLQLSESSPHSIQCRLKSWSLSKYRHLSNCFTASVICFPYLLFFLNCRPRWFACSTDSYCRFIYLLHSCSLTNSSTFLIHHLYRFRMKAAKLMSFSTIQLCVNSSALALDAWLHAQLHYY